DRRASVVLTRKSPGTRAEVPCDQAVVNLRRPRANVLQAVVAHCRHSSLRCSSQRYALSLQRRARPVVPRETPNGKKFQRPKEAALRTGFNGLLVARCWAGAGTARTAGNAGTVREATQGSAMRAATSIPPPEVAQRKPRVRPRTL